MIGKATQYIGHNGSYIREMIKVLPFYSLSRYDERATFILIAYVEKTPDFQKPRAHALV